MNLFIEVTVKSCTPDPKQKSLINCGHIRQVVDCGDYCNIYISGTNYIQVNQDYETICKLIKAANMDYLKTHSRSFGIEVVK